MQSKKLVNWNKKCYVQPPVRKSMAPLNTYKKSDLPFEENTVHKLSFLPIDWESAKGCRSSPIIPKGNLEPNPHIKMETDSVTTLSYQNITGNYKTVPIKPEGNLGFCSAPMRSMTTQKHDFVYKKAQKTKPIKYSDNLHGSGEPIDNNTVTKLSYPSPGRCTPSESCKPPINWVKPTIPMDFETCQKLSYSPVDTKPRQDPPWALKKRFQHPTTPMTFDTIYEHSYQPPGHFVECDEQNSYKNVLNLPDLYPKAGL